MRWPIVVICSMGIFVGLALGNAAARPDHRNGAGAKAASAIDSTGHARPVCNQKCRVTTARWNRDRIAKHRSAKHHVARKAKAGTARASVFRAGRPAAKVASKGGGIYRLGKPYVIGGRTFTPQMSLNYRAEGKASWYGGSFHGRHTANGERFDMDALSAAHPTLPLPSYVRVTNLENRRSLLVRVNDRGPYRGHRLIDLSVRAAKLLGFYEQGVAQVRVEYVGRAELAGSNVDTPAAKPRRGKPSAVHVAAMRRPRP